MVAPGKLLCWWAWLGALCMGAVLGLGQPRAVRGAPPPAQAAAAATSLDHAPTSLTGNGSVAAALQQAVLTPPSPGPRTPFIDWTARQLTAFGRGRAPRDVPLLAEAFPLAEQAAAEAARSALLGLLGQSGLLPQAVSALLLRPPEAATKEAHMIRSRWWSKPSPPPTAAPKLTGLERAVWQAVTAAVQQAVATSTSYLGDGAVEVELTWPLDGGPGGLGEAWLLLAQNKAAARSPLATQTAGLGPAPAPARRSFALSAQVQAPTGVVVQARGLHLAPTLWPEVWRAGSAGSAATLLYGAERLTPQMLRAFGVAPFVRSIEQALRHPRVAERAILVRAQHSLATGEASISLGPDDADAVEAATELLREGRFVFLID